MAITLFGSIAVPADSGTSAVNPTVFANPPIASMVAGDLCFVWAHCRTASATIAVSATGGQSWNTIGTSQSSANTTLTVRGFWCRYNGTWGTAPSFSFGATTNNTIVMMVFRPTSGSYLWGVDGANLGTYLDRAAAASFSITGWTPQNPSTVSIGVWATSDDNTWGTISGTGWTQIAAPAAQFRNVAGNDTSVSFAHNIKTSISATNNVSLSQTALGNDAGFTLGITFYEFNPTDFLPRDMVQPDFRKALILPSGIKNVLSYSIAATRFYRSVTFDQPASDLIDFPVLFSGTYSYLKTIANGGKVENSNGYDIRFYADSGLTSLLDFERVFWDGATGECEFWIKIPTLTSASPTVIYIVYGDTSISSDQQDAAGVWSNNYGLIQHLANGTTLSLTDSTGVQSATNHSAVAIAGKIDGGVAFNGSSTSYHINDFFAGLRLRTYSFWINMDTLPSTGLLSTIIGKRYSDGSEMAIYINDAGKCRFLIYAQTGSQICDFVIGTGTGTGAWIYVSITIDNDAIPAIRAYFNGVADSTTNSLSGGDIKNNTDNYYFGEEGDGSRFLDGNLDEVHISSNVARTATWIATEYSNQNDPANFYSIGSET